MKSSLAFVAEVPQIKHRGRRGWVEINRVELEQNRGKWTVMKTGKPQSLNTCSYLLKKRWVEFEFAVRGNKLYVRARPLMFVDNLDELSREALVRVAEEAEMAS